MQLDDNRQQPSIPIFILAAGALLALLAAYSAGPSFTAFFTAEDFTEWGSYLGHDRSFWSTTFGPLNHIFFRPTVVAWSIICGQALPLSPAVYHLRNWIFDAGALLFEYLLLLRLTKGHKLASFAGCGLVAISKIQLTLIGYSACFTTTLSWFHSVACLYFLAAYLEDRKTWQWVAHFVALLLAIGSRDSGVVLFVPLVAAWFFAARDQPAWGAIVRDKSFQRSLGLYAGLAVVFLALRLRAVDYLPSEQNSPAYVVHIEPDILRRIWVLWGNIWNLSLDPATMGMDGLGALLHLKGAVASNANAILLGAITLLVAGTLAAARTRNPWTPVALAWMGASLLPPAMIRHQAVYYSLEPLAATGLLVGIALAGETRKLILAAWTALFVVVAVLSRVEVADRAYNWRFTADRVEGAFSEILGAVNTRDISSLNLRLAEPGEDAFWQFALTADGKSPLLPLLLNRSALEVQVGPAPVGSRADFRDLTLRMINGHFQVDSRIRVVRISPSRLAVGEMFNRQPTGDSAIWVDCVNATRSTEVVFDGVVLKSVAASPVVVTALVPPSLVATSGKKRISLRDSSLGLESEPDWVEVGLKAK